MTEANGVAHPALAYAARGWFVLPLHDVVGGRCSCGLQDCKSPGKHPRTATGVKEATKDPAQIQQWLLAWPTMNIGIATGPSDLYVIDVDVGLDHDGKKKLGRESLDALQARHGGTILDAPRVKTGGGGVHLYYSRRGLDLHNTAGDLGPNLDTRGVGGYVVAPPSNHTSGGTYEWVPGQGLTDLVLPLLPQGIVADLAMAKHRIRANGGNGRVPDHIAEGQRNGRMFAIASNLQRMGSPRAAMLAHLREVNAQCCKPPLAEREVIAIIDSVERRYPKGKLPDNFLTHGETDIANSRRFLDLHGHLVRYVHEWEWMIWDGARWQRDRGGLVAQSFAMATGIAFEAAVKDMPDSDERKRLLGWARTTQNGNRIAAMVKLATSDPAIRRRIEDFDTHPGLRNVRNGVLDLATGQIRPHDPELYLTNLIDIEYDPKATCPNWDAFVAFVAKDRAHLADYLRRAAGYTFTGYTRERKLFFMYGESGGNGKTTFINVLGDVLGDLAGPLPKEALLKGRDSRADNALAMLIGKTMAISTEWSEGARIDDGNVKAWTGGEGKLAARLMYKDIFAMEPTFKIWMGSNFKPNLGGGVDDATLERFHLIPCQNKVLPGRKREIRRIVQSERPGILAWIVRGSVEWHANWDENGDGLRAPQEVLDAVEEYRAESDHFKAFVEEMCELRSDLHVGATEMLEAMNAWLVRHKEREVNATWLGLRLKKFDTYSLRREKTKHYIIWHGIGLGKDHPAALQATLAAGVDVAVKPRFDQHTRMAMVLEIVRDLAKKNSNRAHYGDVMTAGVAAGLEVDELRSALELHTKSNAIMPRGDGHYMPTRT